MKGLCSIPSTPNLHTKRVHLPAPGFTINLQLVIFGQFLKMPDGHVLHPWGSELNPNYCLGLSGPNHTIWTICSAATSGGNISSSVCLHCGASMSKSNLQSEVVASKSSFLWFLTAWKHDSGCSRGVPSPSPLELTFNIP